MQLQKDQNKLKLLIIYLKWYLRNYKFFFNFFFILRNKFFNFFTNKEQKALKLEDSGNFITPNQILKRKFNLKKIYKFSESRILIQRKKILKDKIKKFGGAADIDLIYNICLKKKPSRILETGVALGWSSLAILNAVHKNQKGSLISIDMPYMHKKTNNYVGAAVPKEYFPMWKLYKYPDRVILNKILSHNIFFDLVHYDSDKSYYGRAWFYKSIWPYIKKKGILISDDIKDNLAFVDFAKSVNKKYYLIKNNKKYSGLIIK